MSTLITVAPVVVSVIPAALAGIAAINAVHHRRPRNRATTDREPVHPDTGTTPAAAPTRAVPLVPDTPGTASGPVEHVGATEGFGAELRALRHARVSPELADCVEVAILADTHDELMAIYAAMQAGLAEACARAQEALDPHWATVTTTELRALLAAGDREPVAT